VKRALKVSVQLLASFGFTEGTLRADSALLPIAYYVFHRKLDDKYISQSNHKADRQAIRTWLIKSLLKASGIWGSGLDTLLTALREVIAKQGAEGFPTAELYKVMAKRGKSLDFDDEEINELVEMQYGDRRSFALMTLLFPFVDVAKNHFHIDHVFPKSRFTTAKLQRAGVGEEDIGEFQEMVNCLPNLQLLEGVENIEKQAVMPADWIASLPDDAEGTNYCRIHLLGEVPKELSGFKTFYNVRRDVLRDKIVDILAGVTGKA